MVLSHMTGHVLSGLGAAITSGYGLPLEVVKQMQHADIKPQVIIENCQACGLCLKYCLKEAISFMMELLGLMRKSAMAAGNA